MWNSPFYGSMAPTTTTAPLVLKVKYTPTLTLTYSCDPTDISSQGFTATNAGPQAQLVFGFHGQCTGPSGPRTARVDYYGPAAQNLLGQKIGSGYSLKGSDSALLTISDVYFWWQSDVGRGANYTVHWANGTNPLAPVSTATFNDSPVGITSSGNVITLTGAVRFKTPANGLLTLI